MSVVDLFERHHPAVFGYIRRRVRNPADAEELSQEVFLRAHKAWPRYAATGRDAAWIFRIASNVLSNFKRDDRRAPPVVSAVDLELEAPAGDADPNAKFDLERAIAALPEHEAEAFLLRESAGLGYDEIAAITGATTDAVRNRIFRARSALRTALSSRDIGKGTR
jgi:RNA polymerase sigma-70 factor (ECF subfamily)